MASSASLKKTIFILENMILENKILKNRKNSSDRKNKIYVIKTFQ